MDINILTNILFISFGIMFIGGLIVSIKVLIKTVIENKGNWKEIEKDLEYYQKDIKNNPNKYPKILLIPMIIFLFTFFTIWFSPFLEMITMNKQGSINITVLYVLILFLICILIIVLIKPVENFHIKRKIKLNGNNMMEFPTDYSIGELSYILNNNIEKKKDLSATILNLVSKKCIKIEKNNNELKIIDLKYNIENLKEDEKYIYEWITSESENKNKYSYLKWKEIIVKYISIKNIFVESKINLSKILTIVYIALFTLVFVIGALGFYIKYEKLVLILFMGLGTLFAILMIYNLFISLKNKNKKTYSKETAKTVKEWELFRKYLKAYSNIREAEIESVIIWEKYLAYAMVLNLNLNYKKLKIENLPVFEFLKDVSLKHKIDDFIDMIY